MATQSTSSAYLYGKISCTTPLTIRYYCSTPNSRKDFKSFQTSRILEKKNRTATELAVSLQIQYITESTQLMLSSGTIKENEQKIHQRNVEAFQNSKIKSRKLVNIDGSVRADEARDVIEWKGQLAGEEAREKNQRAIKGCQNKLKREWHQAAVVARRAECERKVRNMLKKRASKSIPLNYLDIIEDSTSVRSDDDQTFQLPANSDELDIEPLARPSTLPSHRH